MKRCFYNPFTIFLSLLLCLSVFGQANNTKANFNLPKNTIVKELIFENQDLKVIFQVIAKIEGITIIVENGISGFKSYQFRDLHTEEILSILVKDNNFITEVLNNVLYVKKEKPFTVQINGELVSINAVKASSLELLYELFVKLNKVVMFKNVRDIQIDLMINNYSLEEIVTLLSNQFGFIFTPVKNGFIVSRKDDAEKPNPVSKGSSQGVQISKANGLYTISVNEGILYNLLSDLVYQENIEYSILLDKEIRIKNFQVQSKNFIAILDLLKDRYNFDYIFENGFVTIYSKTLINSYLNSKITVFYTLSNISVPKLKNNLPPEVSLFEGLKFNEDLNSVSIFGFPNDVNTILKTIKSIDISYNVKFKYYHLLHISLDDFKKSLPEKYKTAQIIYMDKYNSFIITLTNDLISDFSNFISFIDKPVFEHRVYLNNLKADDLLKTIPEIYKKLIISKNDENNFFIIRGQKSDIVTFTNYIHLIDTTKPLLKYNILVIQARDGFQEDFVPNWSSSASLGDQNFINAANQFLNSPSFSTLKSFGNYFSLKLNWAISKEYAKVSANNIVYGLNNTPIDFNNTSTFRYREQKWDETNKIWVESGVIREISIGFFITITGYTNNNNDVYIDLQGKISHLTNANSMGTNSSVLPMTTEKVIKQKFVTKNNVPILAISYKEEQKNISESKTPVVGDIPIVGTLFTQKINKDEMVTFYIFIMPIISNAANNDSIIKLVFDY